MPPGSRAIRASIPLFRIEAGDFKLQVSVNAGEKLIVVERLKLSTPA